MPTLSRLKTPAGEAALVAVALMIAYAVLRMSPLFAIGAFHDDGIYLALGHLPESGIDVAPELLGGQIRSHLHELGNATRAAGTDYRTRREPIK